jgi:ATP-dependent Clp protease ATP-binding subunit ClpA
LLSLICSLLIFPFILNHSEFEKAHPEVWNILLQLFDDGQLTDSHGRTVDFSNTLVVMTSNMGAPIIAELPSHLKGSEPEVQESIMQVVRNTLSPELINRIDECVVFNRLQREHMDQIADIGLKEIEKRIAEGQSLKLDVSQPAKEVLAERGYDIRYGARPLKRTLTRELMNPLSHLILDGGIHEGDTVQVRTRAEAMRMSKAGEAEFGWETGSSSISEDKNDIVVIKNHESFPDDSDHEDNKWNSEEDDLDDLLA